MNTYLVTIASMLAVLVLSGSFRSVFGEEVCSYDYAEYLGNHPNDKQPGWHDGAQGITHGEGDGDAYWYITQRHPNRLWRIPLSHKLSSGVSCSDPGVKCADLCDISMSYLCYRPIFGQRGLYNHFGDLDYFDPNPNDDKGGYVFIPLEKEDTKDKDDPPVVGGVAVYRTPSLEFAGFDYAHYEGDLAPWYMPALAFDDKGNLYTFEAGSPSKTEYLDPRKLNKWKVNWELLNDPGDVDIYNEALPFLGTQDEKKLENAKKVTLLWKMPEDFPYRAMCTTTFAGFYCFESDWIRNVEENVARPGDLVPLGLKTAQGMDFSNDGRLLFILNGPLSDGKCINYALPDINSDVVTLLPREGCGIHAFEVSANSDDVALCSSTDGDCKAVRVDNSYNGKNAFNYQYDPTWPDYEEPEGLDWFDMDRLGAPDIPGDAGSACTDPKTGETLKPCPVSGQLHAMLLNHIDTTFFDAAIYVKHYRIGRKDCQDAPELAIRISPSFYNFEEVPVGGSAQTEIGVRNSGDVDLQVVDIAFDDVPDAGFGLYSVPALPATLSPSDSVQVKVSFMPQMAGSFAAVLGIHSDLPDTPLVSVPFTATAIGFPEQVQNLIEALDEGLASGDLSGAGPGDSAEERAGAFRNMLLTALEYVEAEVYEDACSELKAALNRADSAAPPHDFIAGPAVTVLADEITALRDRLGCE